MSLFDPRRSIGVDEDGTTGRILLLLEDPDTHRILADWLEERSRCEIVELEGSIDETRFDLCIVDQNSLRKHEVAIRRQKREAHPIMLPCLLVTPLAGQVDPSAIDPTMPPDEGESLVDELVSQPIEQVELAWRVSSLLRLRHQSEALTEREAELRRSNRRLEATIDAAPNAIVVVDRDGRVTHWNASAERIFGWTADEVLGEPNPIIPDDKQDEFRTWVDQILDGAWIAGEETVRQSKAGDRLDVRLSTAPAHDGDGNIEGAMAIIEDITEEKQRRARYQAFVEHSSDVITVINEEGRIAYESPSVEALLGYPPGELEGTTGLEVIHPDDREKVVGSFAELLDQPPGSTETVEYRVLHADGSVVWAESTATSRSDTVANGLVINTRDVTDRRAKERRIRESERRYRLLADHFPDGIVALFDSDLRYLLVGPDELPISGLSAEEMEGRIIFDLLPEETADKLAPHYRAALEGEERSVEIEFNDHVFSLDIVPVIVDDEGDRSTGLVVARDITDRVEQARKLKAVDESRTIALEASGAGIWEWTPSTDEMVMHETCEGVFGLDPEEFEGGLVDYLVLVHPEDRDVLEEALGRAAEQNEPFELTYRIIRPDGAERWIDGRGRMITHRTDGPASMVGVNVDITDRKQRQKQLAVVGRVLRHDIRNDMNVITGWAETIQEAAEDPLADYAGRILEHATSLIDTAEKERSLTEHLIKEPQRRAIDVSQIASRVVSRIRAHYADAVVTVDVPDRIEATATENLGVAIEELLENAILHAESERPQVHLSVWRRSGRVRIEVTDDGPGIRESELEVLRTGQTIEPLKHSSGMGLWLVYWIVHRSNGTLEFQEAPSGGTSVTIDLGVVDRV